MELNNLTISFLGDSITEGYGTTSEEKTFHQIIKKKYNLKHAYNYGVCGTRIARQIVPTERNPKNDLTFEVRSEIMCNTSHAIVVFGGTNDYGHGDAPFGTLDSEDKYTFCGAVNSLIVSLKHNFPSSRIIFMTPIHRSNEHLPSPNSAKTLADYAKAIVTICNLHNVDVIDLFGINPLDPTNKELVPDGLHPNDRGHEILANVIINELIKL